VTAITALLLAAAAGFGLARWTGLPAIPFLLLGGVASSAAMPLPGQFVEDALVLGVTVMVFVAGIELSPDRFRGQRAAALKVGFVQFVILGATGMGLALLFGYTGETGAYLALALSASSTLVVVRVLQSRRQLFEPFGRLVTGVLLLQDLLVILLIPVVTRLPDGPAAVGAGVLASLVMVGLAAVVFRWLAPFAVQRLAGEEETLLLVILAILFSFMGLSHLFQLPLVSGAFLAGLALSPFPVSSLVRGQLNSLSDFFNILFFTALGAFLPVPAVAEVLQAAILSLAVLLVTPPLVAFVAERSGFSARPALSSGLLLSQTSEFSLVVGLQGIVLGHLVPGVFTVIVLTTVVTMMLTPFLTEDRFIWKLVHLHPFKRADTFAEPPKDHILLLGCGRNGMTLLELLIVTPNRVVVVDDDPATVESIRSASVPALRGDVSDVEILRSAGADRARIVVSTIRRAEDNAPLLAMVRDIPVLVRAFNVEEGDWIRERGGRPILYSDAAADDFLAWYREEGKAEGGRITAGGSPEPT
jgi:Kef-type K+ transport system membrane component KefB